MRKLGEHSVNYYIAHTHAHTHTHTCIILMPPTTRSATYILANRLLHRGMLQCAAACYSVLQCVAVCCSVRAPWTRILVTHPLHTCDLPPSYMRLDPIQTRDETPLYVWHDSFICLTRLLHMRSMTFCTICNMSPLYVWHDYFIYVTRLLHMYTTSFSFVQHDQFSVYATSLSCAAAIACDTSQLFVFVAWVFYMCNQSLLRMYSMTPPYVWHHSCMHVQSRLPYSTCDLFSPETCILVTWRPYMCNATRSRTWYPPLP